MSVKSNIPGGLLDGVLTPSGQQVVSNKDVDGGTASNTSRITIPKNTKAYPTISINIGWSIRSSNRTWLSPILTLLHFSLPNLIRLR